MSDGDGPGNGHEDVKLPKYSARPADGETSSTVTTTTSTDLQRPSLPPPPYEAPPPYSAGWSRSGVWILGSQRHPAVAMALGRDQFLSLRSSTSTSVNHSFIRNVVLACLVFWFCGFLFGAAAFFLAVKASRSGSRSDAEKLSRRSIRLSAFGFVCGTIFIVVIVVIMVRLSVGYCGTIPADYDYWYDDTINFTQPEMTSSPTPRPCWFINNTLCFRFLSNTTRQQCEDVLDGHVVSVNNATLRVICYHNACKDYVVQDRLCFKYRAALLDREGCRGVDGYYAVERSGRSCYYNDCPGFTTSNNKCYRYKSFIPARACHNGYYESGHCYHNDPLQP